MDTRRKFSEQETAVLAKSAYGSRTPRCPRCSAQVRVEFVPVIGGPTEPIRLMCRRCGAHGYYSAKHLEAMDLSWSKEQKIRIVERYWSSHVVVCPNDGAVLRLREDDTVRPPPPDVYFRCPHCGRSFWSSDVEGTTDPESFEGQFDEIRALGKGGMGEVLLAQAKSDGRMVAAKRTRPELLADETTILRFQRESRILYGLSHPNIVDMHLHFIDERGGVIIMDYVNGGTLTAAINAAETTKPQIVEYFADVVAGVQYLHESGIIHRDLKPDNVLISKTSAQVSDFGLARLVNRDTTTLTGQDAFMGTMMYASPEQSSDAANVTPACDIYSLGLIAYEIATRRSPYHAPVDSSDFSGGFREALNAALSEDPGARPPASALFEALASELAS